MKTRSFAYVHYVGWQDSPHRTKGALQGRIECSGERVYRGPASFDSLSIDAGILLLAAPEMERACREIVKNGKRDKGWKLAAAALIKLENWRETVEAAHVPKEAVKPPKQVKKTRK